MSYTFNFMLNDKEVTTSLPPATVLLDFIRNDNNLTCTKEGCREGDCGACTVLAGKLINGKLKYRSVNSCLLPIVNLDLQHVVTLEGLNKDKPTLIQEHFADQLASQCGFCTPGFLVSLTGYFIANPSPNLDHALNAIAGNICRCTGYGAIKRAIEAIINELEFSEKLPHIENLIKNNILPEYFLTVESQLQQISDKHKNKIIPMTQNNLIVGGGTDIYVQQTETISETEIFSTDKILKNRIYAEDNTLHLSGSVTFEEIKNSTLIASLFPQLNKKLDLIASLPIRNSATIGGNIINASPIGDFTIIFLALDAKLQLRFQNSIRKIKIREFYTGYKEMEKLAHELLDKISFVIPNKKKKFNFEKVSKRTYLDIASVNSAALIETDNDIITSAKISAGGIAPIPSLLKETMSYLAGKEIKSETILECCKIAAKEISPISDIRGNKEYKKILLVQLIKAHFITLFPEQINVEELV